MKIAYEITFEWVCRECGNRFPMLTEDGNEEWAVCCNTTMKMQPMKKLKIKGE